MCSVQWAISDNLGARFKIKLGDDMSSVKNYRPVSHMFLSPRETLF